LLVGFPDCLNYWIDECSSEAKKRVVKWSPVTEDAQLRSLYGTMDVFIHGVQMGESFGYVLCEAMLCGLPVVTLSTPARDNSQVEVVGHGRGGLVVSSEVGMLTAMESLMNDGALRRRIAQQAPGCVKERFDMSAVMPKLVDICNIVLQTKGRRELAWALQDSGYVTRVRWEELRALLHDGIGKPSRADLILAAAVHQPEVYRGYRFLMDHMKRRSDSTTNVFSLQR